MLRILRIKHIGSRRSINLFNQIRNNNTDKKSESEWSVAPDTETITAFPFGYFPWLAKTPVKAQQVVRELNQDIKEENLLNYSPNLFDFIHTSKVEREERIKKPTLSENVLESYILGEESEEKPAESDVEQDTEGEPAEEKDLFKFNLNKYNKRADSADRLVTLNSIFSADKENEKTSANALIENFFNTTAKKKDEPAPEKKDVGAAPVGELESIQVEELERPREELIAPIIDPLDSIPDEFAMPTPVRYDPAEEHEEIYEEAGSMLDTFDDDFELLSYLEGLTFPTQNTQEAQRFLRDVQGSKLSDFSQPVRDKISELVKKARYVIDNFQRTQEFWDEFFVLRQLNEFTVLGAVHYRPIIECDVKEMMFKLYQTNPEEWTMNKLAQKFRIKKLRVEAIIRLQIQEAILRRTQPWLVDDMDGEEIEFLYSEYYGATDCGEWLADDDDRTPMDDYRWRRAGLVAADEVRFF